MATIGMKRIPTTILTSNCDQFDLTECVRQTTIATALYCSVSMMNHSCKNNVTEPPRKKSDIAKKLSLPPVKLHCSSEYMK